MKLPWRRDKGAKASSDKDDKDQQPEQHDKHEKHGGGGIAEAFGFSDVLKDPDRPDDGSRYEDRTDSELHWAETEGDRPGPMP